MTNERIEAAAKALQKYNETAVTKSYQFMAAEAIAAADAVDTDKQELIEALSDMVLAFKLMVKYMPLNDVISGDSLDVMTVGDVMMVPLSHAREVLAKHGGE